MNPLFNCCWLLLLSLVPSLDAVDPLASAKCHELHHQDADDSSAYSNNNCLLTCVFKGSPSAHNMNEGFPCPLAEAGVCRGGQCVPKTVEPTMPPVTTPSTPSVKLGSIEVAILSVSFAKTTDLKTPYANVCLMNTTTITQTLPIKDKTSCSSLCNANLYGNPNPKWNSKCTGNFVEPSAVYIEVKDVPGMHTGGGTSVFLGGASLTIPQLLSHADNGKELRLALDGSTLNSGFINVQITWKALN